MWKMRHVAIEVSCTMGVLQLKIGGQRCVVALGGGVL
jgi:hypothetical protein